jgi:hypothetical protein
MEIRQEAEKSVGENKTKHEQKPDALSPQQLAGLLSTHKNEFIKSIIPKPEQLIDEIHREINKSSPNYHFIIEKLMELRDVKNNIAWHKIKSPSGNEMIVRNATQAKQSDSVDKEAFLIQAANYIRAARAVMGQEFEGHEIFYHVLFKHFMANLQNVNDTQSLNQQFNIYSTFFVNALAHQINLCVEEVIPQLTAARDFVNLEEPTKGVVTLTQLKNKNDKSVLVFQAEIAITKLTDEIINEYQNRQEKRWYNNL